VAHAALESGWGRAEPRFADGRASYNLFGIKAGSNWPGPVVEASTTEFVNGVAEKRVERFRAYGSYAEAFQDYARLLAQSPRYAGVVGSQNPASFALGLQRGGYATDPAYASKLESIINGPTLRQALIG
jgi:flagellar protein FlgJ